MPYRAGAPPQAVAATLAGKGMSKPGGMASSSGSNVGLGQAKSTPSAPGAHKPQQSTERHPADDIDDDEIDKMFAGSDQEAARLLEKFGILQSGPKTR